MTADEVPEDTLWHVQTVGNPMKVLRLEPCRQTPGNPVHSRGGFCYTIGEAVGRTVAILRASRLWPFPPIQVVAESELVRRDVASRLEVAEALHAIAGPPEPWREDP